jgi:hypothetical protein
LGVLHRHSAEAAHEQYLEFNAYNIELAARACRRGRTRAVVEILRVTDDRELAATTSNDFAIVIEVGQRTEAAQAVVSPSD